MNYMASKVETEKALCKVIDEEKPGLVVNTVLPSTALGRILSKHQIGSSVGWVRQLYKGEISKLQHNPACKPSLLTLVLEPFIEKFGSELH